MSHLAPEDVSGRKVRTDNHQGAGRERDLAVIPGLGRGDGGGQDDTGHRGEARGRRVQIQGRVRQMGRPVQVCKNQGIASARLRQEFFNSLSNFKPDETSRISKYSVEFSLYMYYTKRLHRL